MITASWQPQVINSTAVTSGLPAPSWSTVKDKGYTCSGAEYRGDLGGMTSDACLTAAKAMQDQGVNFAIYPGNGQCYACSISGDIQSKLTPKPGAVTFVGKNIVEPFSVSAQLSSDRKTIVARIVNHGTTQPSSVKFSGFTPVTASAVTLASDDLLAENTAADVSNVAPQTLWGLRG